MVKEYKDNDFLTVNEVGALLGVSNRTIYAWIRQRRVRSYRNPGNNIRFLYADVKNMLVPTEVMDAK